MTQQTDAVDDPRPDYMITEMAEHFEEFEAEYRTEPQHHEVVYEDDEVIVVADHTGHELGEWASDYGVDYGDLSQAFHALARQVCDYSWSVSDPIVFEKFEN